MTDLVESTKVAFDAIGQPGYQLKPAENANIEFRRSLYFIRDMKIGECITDKHVRRIRPGFGISPKYFDNIIGKKVKKSIKRGTPVNWDLVDLS